jgi:HAD superfamily hydrolase (TIGR01549 family)
MVKAIIFDLGRVLVNVDFEMGYSRMAALSGLRIEEVRDRLQDSRLAYAFESGLMPSAEFAARVSELMGVSPSFEEFAEIWYSVFHEGPIVPEEFIAGLHERYRLVLLSNTNALHYEMLEQRLPVLKHFDAYTLSYQLGSQKPSPAIYHDAIVKAGCEPGECFYTDDINEYIDGARAAGIQAAQFRGFSRLKSDLQAAGVAV